MSKFKFLLRSSALSSAAHSRRTVAGWLHIRAQAEGLPSGEQRTLMLKPAFALVSMNMTLKSRAFASPSSMDTCLQTPVTRSILEVCAPAGAALTSTATIDHVPHMIL